MPKRQPKKTFFWIATLLAAGTSILLGWRWGGWDCLWHMRT